MRTLLVIPKYYDTDNGGRFYEMPLGLGYVNAALRNAGLDVECLNMNHITEDDVYQVLADVIITKNIDFVLCGSISPFFPILKKVFDTAKAAKPDVITICGGGAVSSEPAVFAEAANIDYGVIGEGEITDVELIQTLIEQGDVSKVKGIVYKTDDGYKLTPPREAIMDLDSIAFPCYDGFNVEEYLDRQNLAHTYYTYYSDNPRIMPMTLARSCPYSCKFCFHPVGNRYRVRSLDNFFAELDELIEKYQINGIIVLDELFSVNMDNVYAFCERIRPYNLHWLVQMRVDKISKELLTTMKEAGCYTISYGLESFSEKVLKNMNKHIDTKDIEHALRLTYEVGIDIQGNFIFGDQLEDRHSIYETMSWWFQHPEYEINLGMIETYPGCGYYNDCVKNGNIKNEKEYLENGRFLYNLTTMSEPEFLKLSVVLHTLNYYYHKNLGHMLDAYEEDGKIVFVTQCAHCGAVNTYRNIDAKAFGNIILKLGCRKCNHRNEFYPHGTEPMKNHEKLEYLCRMLVHAKDEHDFHMAYDILVENYLQTQN